ncbi:hypothetical protein UFOVP1522_33 [uncultured Caudovirales phage]|uniref:Uncharacterized protein n=1 Tax=uncultured Caudovirales phage TaxID=2100421 RepID=A0A6J7XBW0_9CAUD|nr:hypothetical protein UFOVP989_54 [uncultured Caudovirales phage]CAB4181036.1 hypothetical protein UFOVP1075_12 [uncultured Caudovirales phage]CAB4198713.1 hypothetical protein UFOVP1312_4 [uncultured Caudovirales phage]CAB4210927.1 hypothetical protein UFOVP1426_54 [uncultured Caudovirales phage]CAB5227381.1 hypothetical protein UFOVP1522_33 [uncultured Caudovirales phage]
MSETDALSTFDFSTVTKSGVYLKFEAGKPVKLRVLTTDPVVSTEEYVDKKTNEISLNTRFSFIVYNFTDKRAQILKTTPNIAKKIGEIHTDPEFGSNIKRIDIRISPTGEMLERRYDIQVLPKAEELTNEMILEAQRINLDELVKGDRMSFYDPKNAKTAELRAVPANGDENDILIDTDAPIDLSDIPF